MHFRKLRLSITGFVKWLVIVKWKWFPFPFPQSSFLSEVHRKQIMEQLFSSDEKMSHYKWF